MVVWVVMCEWWLARCGVGGALGWWCGCGSGCFLRLLFLGSVGWVVMCEWRLAHWSVGGADGVFVGGLVGYV